MTDDTRPVPSSIHAPQPGGPARRTVLGVAGTTGAAAALGACGSDGAGGTSTGGATAGGASDPVSVPVADVPVGGGKVVGQSVVAQPTEGSFTAFSSTCPHAGCAVSEVTNGTIICPCHGSQFDASTGDVTGGPATAGLEKRTARRTGDTLVVS